MARKKKSAKRKSSTRRKSTRKPARKPARRRAAQGAWVCGEGWRPAAVNPRTGKPYRKPMCAIIRGNKPRTRPARFEPVITPSRTVAVAGIRRRRRRR